MVNKTLKKKVLPKRDSGRFVAPIMDSAREIWLAGLGAFSVAQHESGKLVEQGSKLFDKLVAEGSKLEKQTRNVAGEAVEGIRGGVESRVDAVKQQASDNWDKLESVFEDRVARVLGRMGVPTSDEVNKLSARVQKLAGEVAKLGTVNKPAKPVAKKAAPVAKKKTVAKKAAVKAA